MPDIIKWLSKKTEAPKPVVKEVSVNELAPPPPLQKTPPPPEIPKPPPPEKIVFTPPKVVKEKVLDSMPSMKVIEQKPQVAAVASQGSNLSYTPPPPTIVDKPKVEEIYTTYDEPPVPPGGADGYKKFLEEHIHFPQQAVDAGASGTVYVSIVVSKDGSLSDVHVEKDNVHYGCGDEAVRVIKTMPPWKPGKMNGVAVKVRYVIPVKFTLH